MENDKPTQVSEVQRFHAFVSRVSDYAIYSLTPEGNVSSWNAGAQRFKGYTPEEIIGRHFSLFYTPEDRATRKPWRALDIALREGKYEEEGWRQRKDGTRFWASVVIDPIHDEDGTLVGFAKVTRDITERKEAEEALQRAKEALFQAQKLEAIGKLTGGIAHDFNNLLGVIVSGLELFAGKVNSPAEERVYESMQRAASRASTLTQQLLTFARRQPLKRDRHNINRVILTFEAVLRRAAPDTDFELALGENLPRVLVDSTQLEAALLNLVSNARDAMTGTGKLSISSSVLQLAKGEVGQLAPGRYVRITVADTGVGMTPEVLAHAVEPFFTTKEVGKGTGMGLSQVYGLIQQSGGDMLIDSAPGKGTRVHMYLPAVDEPEETARDADRDREKALLVDDQPDVLGVAVELFRNMGYEVLSANNGKDALDILTRTPDVDVLFTDIVMPGMNGLELSRRAKEMRPDLKVVLASGYPISSANPDGNNWNPGFVFLHKPYRLPEIMKALRVAS